MKRMPKVSVIMPVYNVAPYLKQCMDSVISQTLTDIDIICGDGGSTDGSLEILQEYARRDARIQIVCKEDSGYGQSVNDCVKIAHGEYIGIVETDDFVKPEMFETLYSHAVHMNADIVKSDYECFTQNPDGSPHFWPVHIAPARFYNCVFTPREVTRSFRFRLNTWTGIYRRTFLEENQIQHNTSPGGSFQDNGFWFQTFALAKRVVILPYSFYCYRQDNPNSSIHNPKKIYCICDEYDFIEAFLHRHSELETLLNGPFWMARFGAYCYTLQRIAEEYRYAFLLRMQNDFSRMPLSSAEIRRSFSGNEWKQLKNICKDPMNYYLNYFYHPGTVVQEVEDIQAVNTQISARYQRIMEQRSTLSYRIFNVLLWFPRKIMGGYYCLVEHGWGYTWNLLLQKLSG